MWCIVLKALPHTYPVLGTPTPRQPTPTLTPAAQHTTPQEQGHHLCVPVTVVLEPPGAETQHCVAV